MEQATTSLMPKTRRMTSQRRVILEELKKHNIHPTADELYEIVRKRLPRISLGTVYRNLDTLSELGDIRKLELTGSQKRFDGDVRPHYHIRCSQCGRIDDVHLPAPGTLAASLRPATDYMVTGHQIEFNGLCPDCARQAMDQDDICALKQAVCA